MTNPRTPAIGGNTRPRGSLRTAAALAAIGALLVAACTTDPPAGNNGGRQDRDPTAVPSTSVSIPYADGTAESASAFRAMRKVDLCALLEPAAAQQAVGEATADRLLPETYGRCTLEVMPAGVQTRVDAWTFSVEFIPFDDYSINEQGAKPQAVPGAPDNAFYRQKSSPPPADTASTPAPRPTSIAGTPPHAALSRTWCARS